MEIAALAIISTIAGSLLSQTFKNVQTQVFGKKFAVLGASTAGKTTLFRYLEMLPMESTEIRATRTVSNTEIGEIKITIGKKSVCFLLKPTKDMPGDKENRNMSWNQLVEESDIILYIINAYKFLRGEDKEETQKRVKEDLSFIRNASNSNSGKIIIIIGNHFDEIDEGFASYLKIDGYIKEFKDNEIIAEEGRGMEKIIASFKDYNSFKEALADVCKIIESKSKPYFKKALADIYKIITSKSKS
jgi:hypothetical protein